MCQIKRHDDSNPSTTKKKKKKERERDDDDDDEGAEKRDLLVAWAARQHLNLSLDIFRV
jgi:hypothetical protein